MTRSNSSGTDKRKSASKRLLKELPTPEQMENIIDNLRQMPAYAVAITGTAYLEHILEILLKTSFRKLKREDETRLFDGNSGAVLGTFSAKIRIAHATKLIGANSFSDLMVINDIRNTFAHSLHKVTFATKGVKEDCLSLAIVKSMDKEVGRERDKSPKGKFCSAIEDLFVAIRVRIVDFQIEESKKAGERTP